MFAVVLILFACIVVLSLVTFGIGALCAVPLVILFIPLGILVYALMEQGVSAVLVDNLGFSSALQRAWELVKKNLGVMALLSIIIYLGATIISMIISVPMMIPMFGFIFNMGAEPDLEAFDRLFRSMSVWMLAFSPLYAVLQGILLTYMQSVWTLTYMRLTRQRIHPSRFPELWKQQHKGVTMNFNFGEVLTRAWQIIWKHKVLWIFGILAGCGRGSYRFNSSSQGGGGEGGFGQLPPELLRILQTIQENMTAFIVAGCILLLLIWAVMIFLGTIGRIGLIRGTFQTPMQVRKG